MTTYILLLQLKEEILHDINCEKEMINEAKKEIKRLRREGAPKEDIWFEQNVIRESRAVIYALKHFANKIDKMLEDV